jgi:proline iminopeptidase
LDAFSACLDRPTIVIHGEQDVLPVESAKELAATLPDATLAVVPGAGHLPFLEAPDLFFRLVEEFLSDP